MSGDADCATTRTAAAERQRCEMLEAAAAAAAPSITREMILMILANPARFGLLPSV